MSAADEVVHGIIGLVTESKVSALHEVAANAELDRLQGEFDSIEDQLQGYLSQPTLVSRIEDDLALAEPGVDAAAAWVIPLLSAAVTIPGLSLGLALACKLALAVYDGWAKRRVAHLGGRL